jgi:hypothetical protein
MATAQNGTRFRWSKEKRKAAQLLAGDTLTDEQIARKLSIGRRTLARWKKHPDFDAQVQALVAQFGALAERYAIGLLARRIAVLNRHWLALQKVIKERAKSPEMQGVPGGTTGLLVHEVKCIGAGERAQVAHLYRLDTALLRELRAVAKQAAQELGQWRADRKPRASGDCGRQASGAVPTPEIRPLPADEPPRLHEPTPDRPTVEERADAGPVEGGAHPAAGGRMAG